MNPEALFLAGDSAGAQIAGQVANIITSPEYALGLQMTSSVPPNKLKGLILHCGAFDASLVNFDGGFGFFLKTVFWAYFGNKNFRQDPRLREFSVIENMSAQFPPFFISAGNGDLLEKQSLKLAERAQELGIPHTWLFYEKNHTPALGHEYQFNLDTDEGQRALRESLEFLRQQLSSGH